MTTTIKIKGQLLDINGADRGTHWQTADRMHARHADRIDTKTQKYIDRKAARLQRKKNKLKLQA